jgi:hypothetical protein
MSRYFFDTDDGDFRSQDDEGMELPDAEAARLAALDVLPDMARDKLPDGDRRSFSVRVRDEAGAVLYSATLDLVGEWHNSLRNS